MNSTLGSVRQIVREELERVDEGAVFSPTVNALRERVRDYARKLILANAADHAMYVKRQTHDEWQKKVEALAQEAAFEVEKLTDNYLSKLWDVTAGKE